MGKVHGGVVLGVLSVLAAVAIAGCALSTAGSSGGAGGGSSSSASASIGSGGASSSASSSSSSTSASTGSAGGGGAAPPPTCFDGLRNGDETDVDCGGDACPPCGPSRACRDDADCSTFSCTAGHCAATRPDAGCATSDQPTCNDCLKNGSETDVDCGGDACPPCAVKSACLSDADCQSGLCMGSVCQDAISPTCVASDQPTCADCQKNGDETDVDCGGDACLPCPASRACLVDADCITLVCIDFACAPAETGVSCLHDDDCSSQACVAGGCWTGSCCK